MQGSLHQLSLLTSPAVAHFAKEVFVPTEEQACLRQGAATSTGILPGTLPAPILFPTKTIYWLYEEWRAWRGVDSFYRIMNTRTFTHVFTNLDPDQVGIHPLASGTRQVTKRSITVFLGHLYLRPTPCAIIPHPFVRSKSGAENIGVASGPFDALRALREAPPDSLRDMAILKKYLTRQSAKIKLENL